MTEARKLSEIFIELIDGIVESVDTILGEAVREHPAFNKPTPKAPVDEEFPLIDVPIEWTRVDLDLVTVAGWEAGTLLAKVHRSRLTDRVKLVFGLWVKFSSEHHKMPPNVAANFAQEGQWGVVDFQGIWYPIRFWAHHSADHYLVYQPKPS